MLGPVEFGPGVVPALAMAGRPGRLEVDVSGTVDCADGSNFAHKTESAQRDGASRTTIGPGGVSLLIRSFTRPWKYERVRPSDGWACGGMADARDLGSRGEILAGSSPVVPTTLSVSSWSSVRNTVCGPWDAPPLLPGISTRPTCPPLLAPERTATRWRRRKHITQDRWLRPATTHRRSVCCLESSHEQRAQRMAPLVSQVFPRTGNRFVGMENASLLEARPLPPERLPAIP